MKTVFVTGASRGIGQAIALALASAGYCVYGSATRLTNMDSTVKAAEAKQTMIYPIELNVTDLASCESSIKTIEQKAGHSIEILVNNAGLTRDNLLLRMREDEWHTVINTNLTSVFRLSRLVLRGMIKARWGRIINITSVVGSSGNPGQTNYTASKAAIGGFSRSLAQEVGNRNITVNCLAPGFIDTDMTDTLSTEQKDLLIKKIPTGRLGKPDDIAQAVLFLSSDMASYINGETLHINGGMYMTG